MVSSKFVIAGVLVAAVSLTGCFGNKYPKPDEQPLPSAPMGVELGQGASGVVVTSTTATTTDQTVPVIRPGNLVSVSSSADATIKRIGRVAWDGTLDLPYNVQASVGGMTLSEARDSIESAYGSIVRARSHIKIRVEDSKGLVRSRGLVVKPGEYLVEKGGNIDELVAASGGLIRASDAATYPSVATIGLPSGARSSVRLDDYYSGFTDRTTPLYGGETVLFHDGASTDSNTLGVTPGRVRFLGEVKRPGEFPIRDNSHFVYYLVQAGGPTSVASLERVRVWRNSGGDVRAFEIDVNQANPDFQLASGDLVWVPGDARTNLERATTVVGGIGSFVGGVAASVIAGK